jgi:RNA polymerase sigma factor (sigma-70 family)
MTAVDRSLPGQQSGGGTRAELTEAPDAGAEDRALLKRLRAGEDSAFGELFARHSAAVRRLAFGLVSDRSEAEDLTAEAFFRVLQAIRRGSGPVDNVRGYLLIVARRVAWEWRTRRRDVPVSDEELTHRAGADPDTSGQSTERNLIARAFTSLPERWRSVLWKVEVEGERPAVVANNFGLSPNATAALARRARQGLRAAYLQAHLAADLGGTGCRSVLEKLGAYTAGSIKGTERRRIRAHLVGCPSCTTMHAELREVCSGLRAHAAVIAAPLAAAGGLGAAVKGVLAGAKAQIALVASSATVVGVLGIVAGPWGTGGGEAAVFDDLDGKGGVQLEITGSPPSELPESIVVTTGMLSTSAVVPSRRRGAQPGAKRAQAADAPVIYRETNVLRRTEGHSDYMVVYETTSVTEVDSASQTNTYVQTTNYTETNGTFGITESGDERTDQPASSESVEPTTSTVSSTDPTTTLSKPVSRPATTTGTAKPSDPPSSAGRK